MLRLPADVDESAIDASETILILDGPDGTGGGVEFRTSDRRTVACATWDDKAPDVVMWVTCASFIGPARTTTPARARERRAARSTKASRAGPSADDPDPSDLVELARLSHSGEWIQLCKAVLSDVRALRMVIADVCAFDDRAQYALNGEARCIEDRVRTALEAEYVALAVGS